MENVHAGSFDISVTTRDPNETRDFWLKVKSTVPIELQVEILYIYLFIIVCAQLRTSL